jgi:hypothetical protein
MASSYAPLKIPQSESRPFLAANCPFSPYWAVFGLESDLKRDKISAANVSNKGHVIMKTTLLKILVTLLFLSSCAGAYMGYKAYQRNQDLTAQVNQYRTGLNDIAHPLGFKEVDQLIDPALAATAMSRMSIIIRQIQDEKAELSQQTITLRQEAQSLEEALAVKKAELNTHEQALARASAAIQKQQEEIAAEKQMGMSLVNEVAATKKQVTEMEKTARNLEDQQAQIADDLKAANATIERQYIEIATFSGRGPKPGPKEEIEGKVIKVNAEYNFVVLNVGETQGVQKSWVAVVHRDDKFVGKLKISKVEADSAVADIQRDWVKRPILAGDRIFIETTQ